MGSLVLAPPGGLAVCSLLNPPALGGGQARSARRPGGGHEGPCVSARQGLRWRRRSGDAAVPGVAVTETGVARGVKTRRQAMGWWQFSVGRSQGHHTAVTALPGHIPKERKAGVQGWSTQGHGSSVHPWPNG